MMLTWIIVGAAWIIGVLFVLALCRMAAPFSQIEQEQDDQAQIEYLKRPKDERR